MHLKIMWAKLSCAPNNLVQNTQEKAALQKTKVNATKIQKVRADRNKIFTGKNGGHRPSSLGGRLIVVVSE